MIKGSFIKKIATTQMKRKSRATDWVALNPGDRAVFDSECIVFSASSDNSGKIYLRRNPLGRWAAKSRTIGDSITVSNQD